MGEQGVESGGGFEARIGRYVREDEPEVDPVCPAGLDHRELLAAPQAHIALLGGEFNVVPKAADDAHQGVMDGAEAGVRPVQGADEIAVLVCAGLLGGTLPGEYRHPGGRRPELTPYKGGWCGNDLFPDALSEADRNVAIGHVRTLGTRLAREGYEGLPRGRRAGRHRYRRGVPGRTEPPDLGVSSMTNVTPRAYADMPLFLFHLLQFIDVDYTIDVAEINERSSALAAVDVGRS